MKLAISCPACDTDQELSNPCPSIKVEDMFTCVNCKKTLLVKHIEPPSVEVRKPAKFTVVKERV